MILLPKAIYGFNALPTKALCYSSEKQKNNFKIYTDVQMTPDSQSYYTKGITIACLTSYYRAVVIKKHGTSTKTDTYVNRREQNT